MIFFLLKEIFSLNGFGLSDLIGFKAIEISFFEKSSLEAKFKKKKNGVSPEMKINIKHLGYFQSSEPASRKRACSSQQRAERKIGA